MKRTLDLKEFMKPSGSVSLDALGTPRAVR
jgi:hypothetical protein